MFFVVRLITSARSSPPHRRRAHAQRISRCHQQLHLIGFQRLVLLILRPPDEFSSRKSFLCQPVSLPIVGEQANSSSAAAAKHEDASGKRVFGEFVLTQLR